MGEELHATPSPQTPAQWAVRWHVLVAAALLLCGVPAWHLVWHGVFGHEAPALLTKSTVRRPEATPETVLDGKWMVAMDRYLREAAPATFWLRGTWNETLYRLGVPQSRIAHFGEDGWLFGNVTLQPDVAALRARAAERRRMLQLVQERVAAAGAVLFVMIVPDKARVYPEQVRPGALSPAKEAVYDGLLAELRQLGIATTDLASVLRAARAANPAPLYKPRDTHWEPTGAFIAAQAVAAAIEASPVGARLAPRQPVVVAMHHRVDRLGDLAASAGFLSLEQAGAPTRSVPMSLLTYALQDRADVYHTGLATPQGAVPFTGEETDAEILLAGTSFSHDGSHALRLALGRAIRLVQNDGAAGIESIREAIGLLPQQPRTRLVIWEIVERGFFEEAWRNPSL